jgi:transposase
MAKALTLRHERVDDIPLIIGLANQLRWPEILDRHLGTHGLHEGVTNGQLAVGWLAYLLSQADHRTSAVRAWANALPHTLGQLLGQPIRAVEFSDDRWGGVLRRLSDEEAWAAIEPDLWAATVAVYMLELTGPPGQHDELWGSRGDRRGGMPFGPSKDHRPDLPQLKLMAAAAEPSGHLLACDMEPGPCADDPLDTRLLQRGRQIVGRTGLL